MSVSTNTINPTSTIVVPGPTARGTTADGNSIEVTLAPAASAAFILENESYPMAFSVVGQNVTTPANQSIAGTFYLSSSTSTGLISNVNNLVASSGTDGQLNIARSNNTLLLTAGPTSTIKVRLTRIS